MENLCNKIQLKGPQRQKQTQEQNKKEWASLVGLCQRHQPQHPHHMKVSLWGLITQQARMVAVLSNKKTTLEPSDPPATVHLSGKRTNDW